MKTRKKEAPSRGLFLIIAAAILLIGGIAFIRIDSPTGMAQGGIPGPPSGEPPGGGGGGSGTTTTTTATESGGVGPTPVKIIFKTPQDGDIIKGGVLTILVEGYEGKHLSSELRITAESELFGTVKLINDFEERGEGIYGANATIGNGFNKGEYAVVVKGERETHDEERILITLDPTIYINASLDKEEYFKGERIIFSGNLRYFNQEPVKNNIIEVSISAEDFFLNKTIISDLKGRFGSSYLISFAEPDREWEIKISAADKDSNKGSVILPATVSTPEGVAFYTVTFLSPLNNAEFKRGSIVPITIEIKEEGKPVENAVVDFKNPRAEIISLEEAGPGTYTAEYKIKYDDPLGKWHIAVQAVKTKNKITKAGGTKIPVTILPAAINLVLVKPVTANFLTGLRTEIRAELSYPDGTKIEKADVFAAIGNETIKLAESDLGVYSAFYLFTEKDVNAASLKISASDIYGNSIDLAPRAIEVEYTGKYELKLSMFYHNIFVRYWYLFVLGISLAILVTSPLWYNSYLKGNLEIVTGNEKRVVEMEKDTQRKYFKYHSITKDDYDKLMLKYRERASDLKEKSIKLKNKLAGEKRY